MSVSERDYSKGERKECMFPHCSRPVCERGEYMCELHEAISEADFDGCEAHSAAEEFLPSFIRLAEVAGNHYLEAELKELRRRAHDYSELRYMDYEMLHIEDRMENPDRDLEDE